MSATKVLTEALLKNIMTEAMVFRGDAHCIEDCITSGSYSLNAASTTTLTAPLENWNYGWLEVKARGQDIHQRLIHVDGGRVFERVKRGGSWRSWYQVAMTPVT